MSSVYRAPGAIIVGVNHSFQQRGVPYRWELQGYDAALSGQPVGSPVAIGLGAQVQLYRNEQLGAYGVVSSQESWKPRIFLLQDPEGRQVDDPSLFLKQLEDPQSQVRQALDAFIRTDLEIERLRRPFMEIKPRFPDQREGDKQMQME